MIKQENNRIKLGNNRLRMFVDKNAILSWEWARVVVRIRCNRGVPRFQKLSDARTAVVKINDMVMRPSMISNSGAFARCFYIPYVFFFPRIE